MLKQLYGLRGFEILDGADIYKMTGLDHATAWAWLTSTLEQDKFHRA